MGVAGDVVYLAGSTSTEQWTLTGCLNYAGFIFLEDKHGSPPSAAPRQAHGDRKYPLGE